MKLTENEINVSQERVAEILSMYTLVELYKQRTNQVVSACWKCDGSCTGKSDDDGNY